MLTNYFIKPHPALSAFVDNYILSTSGEDTYSFHSYWPASNKTAIAFYLGDKPQHQTVNENSPTFGDKRNCIVGSSTGPGGIISFSGRFHTFLIDFNANGINRLFGLAMHEFADEIFTLGDVLGNGVASLEEQLLYAVNIHQMAGIADTFLLSFLKKQKQNNAAQDSITAISNSIHRQLHPTSVEHYACATNMSLRNFQRRFKEQVGISPKLYLEIFRFNQALKQKILYPGKTWTSIAYECGYFDQMHLIKDFKAFTGFTPFDFFKHQHPEQVKLMPITRFISPDFFRMQHQKQIIIPTGIQREKNPLQVPNKPSEEQLVFVHRESY
ncbi:MAG TPA: AraC family transcriptional regulator [Hanamia sp.]|nr:AraC family transcriptional regulator [Hanamia sp.]